MPQARAADTVTFTDVTKASGITFSHVSSPDKKYILESMSGGVALFDFDNDHLLDVYLVNSPTVASAGDARSARSELWRNRGDGTFADVTDKAGVGYPGWGMGAVAADFDGDGWTDLYVTCFGPNHLYRNNGDGTFTDVTAKAGVGDRRWSTGAAFADYDRDGRLDLFVANYADLRLEALPEFGKGKFCEFHGIPVQCGPRGLPGSGDSLYRNKGDGTFEDVSEKAGVADPAGRFGMGAIWSDFDDDGHPDLFVANDAGPNFLYRNTGRGTFADVSLQSGTALSEDGKEQGSMGVAIGDYNHSGGWSILVTNFSDEYNALYRHDKGFQFTDASFISQTAKASIPLVGWGTHFLDYDNDGWLDLFVANGHVYPQVERAGLTTKYAQRKLLYRNNRDGTFTEVMSTPAPPSASRGSAAARRRAISTTTAISTSSSTTSTALRRCCATTAAIAALISLWTSKPAAATAAPRVRWSPSVPAISSSAQNGAVATATCRTATRACTSDWATGTTVDSMDVRWPDGTVQRFGKAPANRFIKIVQGSAPETVRTSPPR